MFAYITIFGKEIGVYAICAMVGFFAASAITFFQVKKYQVLIEDVILIAVFAGAFGLIGAHLMSGISQISQIMMIISNWSSWIDGMKEIVVCFSGKVYYGGFIGAYLGIVFYSKHWLKEKKTVIVDVFATVIPLFHFFGRIGCFFGGCCYGIESKVGFFMPYSDRNEFGEVVKRFPVQLLEAAGNLLIFVFLYCLLNRKKMRGKIVYLYILLYAPMRFLDEFLRADMIRGMYFGLSTSQLVSFILIIYAAVCLIRCSGNNDLKKMRND